MHIRVCQACGEEYRPDSEVLNCSDCGGIIVAREPGTPGIETRRRVIAAAPEEPGAAAYEPVRSCQDCGEEYRLDAPVSTCADCGGPIVVRAPGGAGSSPETATGPSHPGTLESPVRLVHESAVSYETDAAAARLVEAEIPFDLLNIEGRYLRLFVRLDDEGRARTALGDLVPPVHDPGVAFDPERGYQRCPACDTEIGEGATTCRECGLMVAAREEDQRLEHCPRCDGVIDREDTKCGWCGYTES
jgi:hypothetical protein